MQDGPAPLFNLYPTASRESFCLAALLQNPRMIYKINRAVSEYLAMDEEIRQAAPEAVAEGLAQYITTDDFARPEHRAIFAEWSQALAQAEQDPISYLLTRLDASLRRLIERWLSTPLDALREGVTPLSKQINEEYIYAETIKGLLHLREQRLKNHERELVLYLEESDNGGDSSALREHIATIDAIRTAKQKLLKAHRDLSFLGRAQ